MALARIISIVFHPLLMATYLYSFFAFALPVAFDPIREDDIWNFVFLLFCVTFVLPVLNIGLFKSFGTIKSFSMEERKERLMPFIFITVLYCVVTYLFYSRTPVTLKDNFVKFLLIIDALVILSTLITFFYKVSVHSIAIWGLIGILLPLNKIADSGVLFYPMLGFIVLAGVIMSARLKLNVHTPREVMVGGMVGFATGFMLMTYLF
jgi:membrane-associated phospholipid phosphatase